MGAVRTGVKVAEARKIVLEWAAVPLPAETVAAQQALGRVLAEPVRSSRTLPPADCSAMDGFALRAADLTGVSPGAPRRLKVAFEVRPGGPSPPPLPAGQAARIFTGAPLPPGADSVVRQEEARALPEAVELQSVPELGAHVRRAGEDVRAGDVVLERGVGLGPAELGMLASLGRSVVRVHRRPRVALLSSGDELVEPDADASGGRIVGSNVYALAAQCREAGAEPLNLGIARDTPEELEERIRAGLGADLLVSSAGVSVGDHDHVRPVLEKLGCRLLFWGVRMKPGYPLAFGRFEREGGPLVFGLPGNPVSAMVTFELFVRPLLLRLAGWRACFRPLLPAVLGEPLRKKPGRQHFVRVRLERRGERWVAHSTGSQSSGVLRSMVLADGLLAFGEDETELAAGAPVSVLLLDSRVLAREDSGS